ncbi:hypothetical protein [Acinetobacter rudis]|uniref:hypothetical protein n=1 Tax=Acinetobacter rudis TaxID=632955 RepID=UPI003341BCC7
MKKSWILALAIPLGGLTACQSPSVNKVVRDLSSPNGDYHVEVRQCRANDVMFGKATQVQVSVLKKGESEKCRTTIQSVAQFNVYATDFRKKEDELQLKWLSNNELQAWHRSFGLFQYKSYIGPFSYSYGAKKPVTMIFSPLK